MINFLVCNDSEIIREKVKKIIDKIMMKNDYNYRIYLYDDYDKDFIKGMNSALSNKIYILDIQMPSDSGIDVARRIRERDMSSTIIFLSEHYEEVSALLENELMFLSFISELDNYRERLSISIKKALKMVGVKQAIKFKVNGYLYAIPIDDILYITRDSVNRKCIMKTDYTEFQINKTLLEFSNMLGDNFIKTHRSCLINKNRYRMIDTKNHIITFDNNQTIDLLSNIYKKELEEKQKI